jgi:hypothetical protein
MSSRPPERDEREALLDPLLDFAQELLRKRGEFFPFGATMSAEGEVSLAAAATDSDQPASQDVIDLLAAGMRQQAQAGAIRATGICYDSRFALEGAAPSDAIAVSLEHRDGDAVLVMQPYSKGRFSGFTFGDLVAVPPERRVFAPDH